LTAPPVTGGEEVPNEPSRSAVREFIVGCYMELAAQRRITDNAAALNTLRARQIAYASVLFFIERGHHYLLALNEFREFMQELDEECARRMDAENRT
jgi:hypothetical protein